MDVDPYKLFGLTKNFEMDELKQKFKQLALVSHPDRGGSEELFLLVTKCFKTLMKEYNRRVADAQHHELKKAFEASIEKSNFGQSRNTATGNVVNKDGFNLDRFNSIFEQNRINNTTDEGYSGWMTQNALGDIDEKPKKPIPKDKFNVDTFNSRFEQVAANKTAQDNKFVVKYKEPEPLVMAKKIQFTELGVDKIDDFSGDNTTKRNLNFMDYKVAHTTSRIVDPRTVQRRDYKNIGEVEFERDNLSYVPTSEDIQYWEEKKRKEEMAEQRRLQIQAKQDQLYESHYEKLKRLMIQGR